MTPLRKLFGAAFAAALLPAQPPTLTAVAATPLRVRTEHFQVAPRDVDHVPAGTDVLAGLDLSAQSGAATGTWTLNVLPAAITTIRAHVACSAVTFGTAGAARVMSEGDVLVTLAQTTPARGVLAVWIDVVPSGGAPGVGNFAVDIDDDGTFELTGNPFLPPHDVYGEFPRALGRCPLPIRIRHDGEVSVPRNDIGDYAADLVVRWIPDTGAVTSYGAPCGLALTEQRGPASEILLWLVPAPGAGTFLLFGDTRQSVPLPLPPGCPLLTDIDAFAPWTASPYVVPYVALPPGFVWNAQAVTFESPGSTLTSNGLALQVWN